MGKQRNKNLREQRYDGTYPEDRKSSGYVTRTFNPNTRREESTTTSSRPKYGSSERRPYNPQNRRQDHGFNRPTEFKAKTPEVMYTKSFTTFEEGMEDTFNAVPILDSLYGWTNNGKDKDLLNIKNVELATMNIFQSNMPEITNGGKNALWELSMSAKCTKLKTDEFVALSWFCKYKRNENGVGVKYESFSFTVTVYGDKPQIVKGLVDAGWTKFEKPAQR